MQTYLKTALIVVVVMAIVYRVAPIKAVVVV